MRSKVLIVIPSSCAQHCVKIIQHIRPILLSNFSGVSGKLIGHVVSTYSPRNTDVSHSANKCIRHKSARGWAGVKYGTFNFDWLEKEFLRGSVPSIQFNLPSICYHKHWALACAERIQIHSSQNSEKWLRQCLPHSSVNRFHAKE